MNVAIRLENAVRQILAPLDDVAHGLVVAVSGGPDSVALLRVLLAVRDPAWPVTVAHLNHQLRGAESDVDEQFVIGLGARMDNVAVRTHRLDVAALAQAEGENLEAVARSARYRWLTEVAREASTRWVLTGHTANDQAETVLHRLLRGTGLQGLRGIAARRPLADDVSLLRPLLRVKHEDVLAYLDHLSQDYREDRTNRDLERTRNRIRHELLPHLAADYNPGIIDVLVRLAEQADGAYREEEAAALALLRETERPRAGTILVFDCEQLARAPRRMVRAVFRQVWMREGWPMSRMDFAAWERLVGLVFGENGGGDYPDGVHARRRGAVVQVEQRECEQSR